jgi:hypothetical protein
MQALFSVMVANVGAEPGDGGTARYRLAGLAHGVGTRVRGEDRIVTADTQQRLGADLDLVTRLLLGEQEKRRGSTQLKARSETLAVVDNPGFLLRAGRHCPVLVRFALLVDPSSGRLDTLVWSIPGSAEAAFGEPDGPMAWLPDGLVDEALLHVDAREFTHGLPLRASCLAMTALPRGRRQIAFSAPLRDLAGRVSLSPEAALELERQLRAALLQPS